MTQIINTVEELKKLGPRTVLLNKYGLFTDKEGEEYIVENHDQEYEFPYAALVDQETVEQAMKELGCEEH